MITAVTAVQVVVHVQGGHLHDRAYRQTKTISENDTLETAPFFHIDENLWVTRARHHAGTQKTVQLVLCIEFRASSFHDRGRRRRRAAVCRRRRCLGSR